MFFRVEELKEHKDSRTQNLYVFYRNTINTYMSMNERERERENKNHTWKPILNIKNIQREGET